MSHIKCAHGIDPFNPWLEPCAMCMPMGAVLGFKGQIIHNNETVFSAEYVRLGNFPTNELQQESIASRLVMMATEEFLIDPTQGDLGVRVSPRYK
jgi:hypothetical protein